MILLVLAAGMGSRFGGVKQITSVDKHDNLIIDYSIFDGVVAGFEKVVFIINRNIEVAFCEKIFNRIKTKVNAEYVFQDLDDLPNGFKVPEGRGKPWGTTQAILAARNVLDKPFCVINADDFYGRGAIIKVAEFLRGNQTLNHHVSVGYLLEKTATKNGSFSRGVCITDKNNMLVEVNERTHIEVRDDKIGWVDQTNNKFNELEKGLYVAVNLFGLTPDILPLLTQKFTDWLKENSTKEKVEYPVPVALNELIHEGKISMQMQKSQNKFFGFTYKNDMPMVMEEINKHVRKGNYPSPLWSKKPSALQFKPSGTRKSTS